MSALKIDELTDAEKVLVARFTYRVFAHLKRSEELQGPLDGAFLQEYENDLIQVLTAGFAERPLQQQEQLEGWKQ